MAQPLHDGVGEVGDVEAGKTTMRDASEAISVLIGFLVIMALLTAMQVHFALAGVLAIVVGAAFNFTGHKLWTFR